MNESYYKFYKDGTSFDSLSRMRDPRPWDPSSSRVIDMGNIEVEEKPLDRIIVKPRKKSWEDLKFALNNIGAYVIGYSTRFEKMAVVRCLPDSDWFHDLVLNSDWVLLVRGRMRILGDNPQRLAVFGKDCEPTRLDEFGVLLRNIT